MQQFISSDFAQKKIQKKADLNLFPCNNNNDNTQYCQVFSASSQQYDPITSTDR